MKKIVVTGSESTGKTTLAEALGERLGSPVAGEFVRTFAREKAGMISFSDHGAIARGQMALEDAAIARARELVVLDTDLVSTVVYCEHYFGRAPAWIVAEARTRAGDLYLLMKPDIPWVADGIRDRGERRAEMHGLFRATLEQLGMPFVEIGGVGESRLAAALAAIASVGIDDDPAHAAPE